MRLSLCKHSAMVMTIRTASETLTATRKHSAIVMIIKTASETLTVTNQSALISFVLVPSAFNAWIGILRSIKMRSWCNGSMRPFQGRGPGSIPGVRKMTGRYYNKFHI